MRSLSITSAKIRSRPSVGSHPVRVRIFEMSGTRRSMSSNPSSYAASYGMWTTRDDELTVSTTVRARSFIDSSKGAPTLKTSPIASG